MSPPPGIASSSRVIAGAGWRPSPGRPAEAGTTRPMPDEREPGQYESEPTRVRGGSGRPWLAVWTGVAGAVVSIGVAGTLRTQPAPSGTPTPASPQEAAVATPSP